MQNEIVDSLVAHSKHGASAMASGTPRTDAFYKDRFKAPDAIDFARQLERELIESTNALSFLYAQWQEIRGTKFQLVDDALVVAASKNAS